ncbi:hypothetical protein K1T71_003301 [Dendrolimus kikuchii]|uniref:Uncharacterized protein n=1 Tax=Dendrolimus kikuchii TaxID=765133 RepID=A0ACC1DC31_9NEOP|nr:hypothetical protein K1T71_003301 [Dendrolimus kikuchii]
MDFTPELSSFQGVLISADNVYSFSRLTAKGGNEQKIDYIIEVIRKFLQDQSFIEPNGLIDQAVPKVRKFSLFLILNANFAVLEEMVEIEDINTVIWTIPTIPKCLLCELIWNLHMEKFLYEAIVLLYPPLALELVEAFLNHFKYINPIDAASKLRQITTACYLQICRLHSFHIEKDDLINKLTTALINLQNSLKLFIEPPNVHKLNVLSKDDLYKYKGKSFQEFIACIYNCFEQFTNSFDNSINESLDIYLLTYKENRFVNDTINFKICDTNNKEILECLNNCNEALLETCKTLIMDISVEIFCAWSEFEENGNSMQQHIGEMCYKLLNKVTEISTLSEHPVMSMMQQIARKPVNARDLINVTDSDTIIENINKNVEDKEAWLHALLERNNLCEDVNLLNVIESNLNNFNPEMSYKLYKRIKLQLKNNVENENNIILLSIKVFQQCNLSDKYKILDETFIDNCFNNANETTEFCSMMTETFNKLIISPETDVEVLTVFLQNPLQVYNKICNVAVESPQQADIMINVSLLLKNYCNHYYSNEIEPCVVKCTRDMLESNLDTENKQNNAIKFTCGLRQDIIPGNKLLLLIIMPAMHKALINRNIANIYVQVRLLKEAYSVNDLIGYRAPMLAMLAQVLDVVRWKINTFTSTSPNVLEATLQLQMSIIETYGDNIPEKEKVWLKNKMINLQPLNMYYYRILWKPPGKNFLEIITGKRIHIETNTNEITSLLAQIICSITQQEWCNVWDSLNHLQSTVIMKIFHDALSIETLTEAANRTDSTWMCIHYCYRCFFYTTRFPLNETAINCFQKLKSDILKSALTVVNPNETFTVETDSSEKMQRPLLGDPRGKREPQFGLEITKPDGWVNVVYYQNSLLLYKEIYIDVFRNNL